MLVEIRQRLKFLNDVGLDYLTLDRLSATLSGGEAQRIQLATCLGSRLVGACYVLDEPSIGLHSRDTARLIRILEELRDLGNTIVVVEHDADLMRAADHIVDLGPGAGELGGRIIFEGPFEKLMARRRRLAHGPLPARARRSPHGRAQRRAGQSQARGQVPRRARSQPEGHRRRHPARHDGGHHRRLRLGQVHAGARRDLRVAGDAPPQGLPLDAEELAEVPRSRPAAAWRRPSLLSDVVLVDQSPIGRTPRSNPVTYIKAFDIIRDLFASTPEADRRGYTPGHFSFNVPGGRCETCQGGRHGHRRDAVSGRRRAGLRGVQGHALQEQHPRSALPRAEHSRGPATHREGGAVVLRRRAAVVQRSCKVLADVGLGYLRLGQSATTLSGGEAQRVKLAGHLAEAACQNTLFIFDEPTTGLHFDDIAKLLDAFERLIHNGASVLIIEHNLEVIRAADWVIDLGPEGGDRGGRIVAEGTPEQIAKTAGSYTGRYLGTSPRVLRRPSGSAPPCVSR